MKYLHYLLNIFFSINFFNIFSLKIKIGKNIDTFIFDQWEEKQEKRYNFARYKKDDESLGIKPEKLFLLLELYTFNVTNDNKYNAFYFVNNKGEILFNSYPDNIGDYEHINFTIDFSNDKPIYSLDISKYVKKSYNTDYIDYDLTKENILNEKTKLFLTDEEIKDKEKFESVKNIIKNLSAKDKVYEEKGKKWAFFKIKIKDDPFERFFYCNDIESIHKVGGIFDKKVEEIEIIKSNCEDIYYMHCFVSNCTYLKKLHLTNLKTKDDIDINTMFYNCKNLKEVIFPKGLKVENIALLFSNSNNIENINFEDLKIDNLYSMALLCKDSNMKKIKFPKCKIKKRSILIIDKKNIINNVDLDQGFLAYNNLEEIDLTNVEFEEGAGKDMFKKNTVKKIILPENMKNLTEQQLKDIFNESDIKIIKIGEYELKIEEFDKIELFIKSPEDYQKCREMIKKLYYNEHITNNNNNNIDQSKIKNIPPDNSCINCCAKCLSKCCCCKRNV